MTFDSKSDYFDSFLFDYYKNKLELKLYLDERHKFKRIKQGQSLFELYGFCKEYKYIFDEFEKATKMSKNQIASILQKNNECHYNSNTKSYIRISLISY